MEIHCGLDQQSKMAKIFREILGDALLLHPLADMESKLPSPEDLKYKILLKVYSSFLSSNLDQKPLRRLRGIAF